MTWRRPIRVIGVGSTVGDDAVAWSVVRIVAKQVKSLSGVESHLVHGGQRLLELLDGTGTLILVDAVSASAQPGTIHRFDWPDVRVEALGPGSTHGMGPADALRLADTLGLLPQRVVLFGIEIGSLDPVGELSPAVQLAAPELARRIVAEIEEAAVELSRH